MKPGLIVLLTVLTGCAGPADRELQMFVAGDVQNSIVINQAAGNQLGVACSQSLVPVAMASPDPTHDGLLTVWAREMALQAAISGPCGSILAPFLLRVIGKAGGPFGVFLPF